MSDNKADFAKDVELDKFQLDEEGVRQSTLIYSYHKALAEAKLRASAAKDELKVVLATVALNLRENPDEYGLDRAVRITEEVARSVCDMQAEIQQARKVLREAEFDVDMIVGAVEAIKSKGFMISEEYDMWKTGYFSDNTRPQPVRQQTTEREEPPQPQAPIERRTATRRMVSVAKKTDETKE